MTDNIRCEKQILITGASGELGGALARRYARPGVRLSLWGRDPLRLSDVAQDCEALGALIKVRCQDLIELDDALVALITEDSADPIDLAIFAAGLGDIRAPGEQVEDPGLVVRLATVNFTAPAAMAASLAGRMAVRGRGRIVLIGSAAGFHALPFAAAYSGTKAGLERFAQALGLGVRAHGVTVTLVTPGFIDTAAGRKVPGPKPLVMRPEVVATRIARAVAKGTVHLVVPWQFVLLRLLDRVLPRPLRDRLLLGLAPADR